MLHFLTDPPERPLMDNEDQIKGKLKQAACGRWEMTKADLVVAIDKANHRASATAARQP